MRPEVQTSMQKRNKTKHLKPDTKLLAFSMYSALAEHSASLSYRLEAFAEPFRRQA
jgi:hypothetical protein